MSNLPSADARDVLTAMADRLGAVRPHHVMDEPRRLALVLRYAVEKCGYTPEADELEREVLRHAPAVANRDISRGEYAALLRLVANGVTAG
jgi:hypothetical protein